MSIFLVSHFQAEIIAFILRLPQDCGAAARRARLVYAARHRCYGGTRTP